MWPGSSALELPPNVFAILRDLIQERTGLFYDDAKRELLAEKLSPNAVERGFTTFLDYYYLLKYGPSAEADWAQVVDTLSVQETFFWREMSQIHAFVNELLPRQVARSPQETVRIWCAACATGEEPLTIAMALEEAGWYERIPIEISASDASPAALAKAARGIYRDRSFRALPRQLHERYFTAVDGGWQVTASLHARVAWSRANLTVPAEVEPLARVPFLFCRNVFIYFSDAMIARTVGLFAQGMRRPGYLFVGAAESLLKLSTDFELQEAGEGFVYALE